MHIPRWILLQFSELTALIRKPIIMMHFKLFKHPILTITTSQIYCLINGELRGNWMQISIASYDFPQFEL